MTIRKYLHSCLLVEENGRKLLIDPGAFSFIEKKVRPEDIGIMDVIAITHPHLDHYSPEALRLLAKSGSFSVVTHKDIAGPLAQEGFQCEPLADGKTITIKGFAIKAHKAPHEKIPADIPHNQALMINGTLLHPGDSLSVTGVKKCEVLALPVAGPWLKLVDALAFAKKLKPKHVIPIHDAIIKDFMLERIYAMCKATLEKDNISFHPLALGKTLEI